MRKTVAISILFLFICLTISGTSAQNLLLQCGSIVEAEISISEVEVGHNYNIQLAAGERVTITADPLGDNILGGLFLYSPDNSQATRHYWVNTPTIDNFAVPATGTYTVNFQLIDKRAGAYVLSIACLLRDGTNIAPGEVPVQVSPVESPPTDPTPEVNLDIFGFPGVSAVDFSAGIPIPLSPNQPMIAPLASNLVILYTYETTANSVATLSLGRLSGDISIGIGVIHQDTNEIVFLSGMPSSNNLLVELNFPSEGTYAIGLFQLPTKERPETSGSVRITIQE